MVKRWGGLYYHHGIDMGDGTVVHFSGEPLRRRNACVCRCSLEAFLKGGKRVDVHYEEAIDTLPPEETSRLAEEQLNQTGYSIYNNNCEHFATYCKTGNPYSEQVKFYVRVGSLMALITVAAVGTAISAKVMGKTGGRPRA